jgi:MFS family permease
MVASGLAASILYRRFGCRRVVMCGGVIASFGCFLSYFATKIQHLYLTYGLLNGIGMGLAYTPTLSVLPDYFDRWRFFASAFATVGSACGTFVFQPIFYRLIETYTWQGSMLINAGY